MFETKARTAKEFRGERERKKKEKKKKRDLSDDIPRVWNIFTIDFNLETGGPLCNLEPRHQITVTIA